MTMPYFEDWLELGEEMQRFELEEDYKNHPEQYEEEADSETS